jgi:hypothetical protein
MRLLGCWYSNNALDPKILGASLNSIARAKDSSEGAEVEVRTCTWRVLPGSPFPGYITHFRLPVHLGIAMQMLKVVYEEERAGRDYDAMLFLEHDVLYPHDYFDRVAAAFQAGPELQGVSNRDYIGLNETGWVQVHTRHEPMHQLSLRCGFARAHLETVLKNCILDGAALLEPDDKSKFGRLPFVGERPCVHVNHSGHFTTHFKIYETDSHGLTVHPYWGDFRDYYPEGEKSIR